MRGDGYNVGIRDIYRGLNVKSNNVVYTKGEAVFELGSRPGATVLLAGPAVNTSVYAWARHP